MNYNTFLIKYAEIGTKGKNRYKFEDVLCQQIKNHVAHLGEFSIRREYGRIFLYAESEYDFEDLIKELRAALDKKDIEDIKTKKDKLQEKAMALATKVYENIQKEQQAQEANNNDNNSDSSNDDNVADATYEEK